MTRWNITEDEADVCPGPCNRAWEAAERAAHDGDGPADHGLHPEAGMPIWCHGCQELIADRLRTLPDLAAQLTPGNLNTPAGDTEIRTRNVHTSPSPAWDTIDALTRWAATEEDALRVHTRNPPGPRRRTLTRSIGFIAGFPTAALSRDPDGIAFGHAVLTWHHRLNRITGNADLVHRLPGQCPACGRRGTMARRDGDDLVQCRCGASWDFERWRWLAHVAVTGKAG